MIHVLLCEDEEQYIEDFILEFGGTYTASGIHTTTFICSDFLIEVCRDLNALDRRLRSRTLPQILIMDLYWPIRPAQDRSIFDNAVHRFNDAVDALKQEVPKYLKPRGYYFLQDDLRRHMHISVGDLPVLLYTKAGQYVLDTDERNAIIKLDGQFLLKRDHPETKKTLIREAVTRFKYRSDVFISYSSADEAIAQETKTLLEEYTLSVRWAPETRAGDDFNDIIRDRIAFSKVIAVILSAEALKSQYVMWEIGAGWALKKKIIAGCIGMQPKNLPSFISARLQCERIHTRTGRSKYIDDIVYQCRLPRSELEKV